MKSLYTILLVTSVIAFSCKKEEVDVYYTLAVSVIGDGTVTPTQGQYLKGTTVNLIAAADANNQFTGWSGDITSNDNPYSLVMDGNKSIIATFSPLDQDGDGVADIEDKCPDTPDGFEVDIQGCPLVKIYLDGNGTTIKAYPWANVGDTDELDGLTYTIVDRSTLESMIASGFDVTSVVTTFISDFSSLFYQNQDFNQPIGNWDVSNAIRMDSLFSGAISFNQPLANWEVENVVNMVDMFWTASSFNQDISNWDVSNVETMWTMFGRAKEFNQPIGNWDVSNVENLRSIFFSASSFNQDLSDWDVSSVVTMRYMFFDATSFNQDVSKWNVGNVTDMLGMFNRASNFNQNLNSWDVNQVTNMGTMFYEASSFNSPLNSWNVGNVEDMSGMFSYAASYNQDLSMWNIEKVTACSLFSTGTMLWTLPKPNFTNCDPN